jgi:ketopantoate hydroxymethyltransferase
VQVVVDMLGISDKVFRHVKKFADCRGVIEKAVITYAESVREGTFPGEQHCTAMPREIIDRIAEQVSPGKAG